MTGETVTFEMPGLGLALDRLDDAGLSALDFGAVLLDRDGTVHRYSTREAMLSGYAKAVVGRNWLTEIAPCMATDFFRDTVRATAENRVLDLTLETTGDFLNPGQPMRIRLVASPRTGHVWMALERIG